MDTSNTLQSTDGIYTPLDKAVATFVAEYENGHFPIEELCSYFVNRLPEGVKAHLIMQLIGGNGDGRLTATDKQFWVTVADTLGPDHTQHLYHAAVFATKVV